MRNIKQAMNMRNRSCNDSTAHQQSVSNEREEVYITQANAIRIYRRLDPDKLKDIAGELYKTKIDIFSGYEEKRLLGIQALFKDPTATIEHYFSPLEERNNSHLVTMGNWGAAYHIYSDCQKMLSDFEAFEIPPAVELRGETEVTRFRKWFGENSELYESNQEHFFLRMSSEFKVSLREIRRIVYSNSGSQKMTNIALERLVDDIDKLLNNMSNYMQEDPLRAELLLDEGFAQKTFLLTKKEEPIRLLPDGFTEDDVRGVMSEFNTCFKEPLYRMLIQYYRVKYNPMLKFSGELLSQLNFHRCSACQSRQLLQIL